MWYDYPRLSSTIGDVDNNENDDDDDDDAPPRSLRVVLTPASDVVGT